MVQRMKLSRIAAALPRRGRGQGGFTLIEAMIVAAIVAIIAAVAYPSYTSHIARGKRADARGQLMQAAQFMQRFYSANDSYQEDRAGNSVYSVIPTGLKQSPQDSTALYNLTVTASVTAYTLTMVPAAGTTMVNDECKAFQFTSTGVKRIANLDTTPISNTALRDKCWK
jgi:type IV pilus assembly protein PilE